MINYEARSWVLCGFGAGHKNTKNISDKYEAPQGQPRAGFFADSRNVSRYGRRTRLKIRPARLGARPGEKTMMRGVHLQPGFRPEPGIFDVWGLAGPDLLPNPNREVEGFALRYSVWVWRPLGPFQTPNIREIPAPA